MSVLTDRLCIAKDALMLALGENGQAYMENMKLWFRYKLTKEEFDSESRKYLTTDKIHLHNQFLISVLNKIDSFLPPPTNATQSQTQQGSRSSGTAGGSSSRKRKRSSRPYAERVGFEPYDFLDFIAEDNMQLIRPPTSIDQTNVSSTQILPTQRYCVQEMFLPDAAFIMGRLLIGAWESGLVRVDDAVAKYLAMAVQVMLKDVIAAILMKRKHYKTTGDGNYYYDIGAPLHDPSLRNTVTRQKVDDEPLELDKEITSPNFMRRSNDDVIFLAACEEVRQSERTTITLKDCLVAFNDRNLIPSHSVHSINMERLIMMMH